MENMFIIEAGRKRRAEEVKCIVCKTSFLRRLNKNTKCCSIKCKYISRRNRIDVKCSYCNSSFSKPKSKLKQSKSGLYFCTRKCKDLAQRIGGIKEIMPSHYGTSEKDYSYIWNQRKHECVDCHEKRTYYLTVHHIDGNNGNNIIENLEIVCIKCHYKRHLRLKDGQWIHCTSSLTPRELLCKL